MPELPLSGVKSPRAEDKDWDDGQPFMSLFTAVMISLMVISPS